MVKSENVSHGKLGKSKEMDNLCRNLDKYKVLLLGFLVHILLLFAVFDIYFASPLDHGMTPVKTTNTPPAKRVFLFAVDGLRAEAIRGIKKKLRVPFLHTIVNNSGSWGIARTRVPTESRPGFVALLAGIYEDPSAIWRSWKANSVDFDSVINQSTHSWSWGDPYVAPIFNRDRSPKNRVFSFSARTNDFGKNITGYLDNWVFSKVELFLKQVASCSANCSKYYSQGNIFFLHLPSVDAAGHGFKPHSVQYVTSIKLVDEHLRKLCDLIGSVFPDNATVFIFTSDHGMTDWGAHGAGSYQETAVPLIAWGAGIRKKIRQPDINQIDVAPLISSLIGINIPVNSLGKVPFFYLNTSMDNLSTIILANTKQLLEIFNVKRSRIQNNSLIHFPYKYFTDEFIRNKMLRIRHLQNIKSYRYMIIECFKYMDNLVLGIKYYHEYYQLPILLSLNFGFLIWMLFLVSTIFSFMENTAVQNRFRRNACSVTIYSIALLTVILLCYKSGFTLSYFLYFSFPLIMFGLLQWGTKVSIVDILLIKPRRCFSNLLIYYVGIELLVYGFFNRIALSILLICISFLVFKNNMKQVTTNREKVIWIFCCYILAIFPNLPVMNTTFNLPFCILGYLSWVCLFYMICVKNFKMYDRSDEYKIQIKFYIAQHCYLHVAAFYILFLENRYISTDSPLKKIAWVTLIVPVLLIPLSDKFIATRLISIFLGFVPFYVIVSTNYEVLFLLFYVITLCVWLFIETKSMNYEDSSAVIYYSKFDSYRTKNEITSEHFRRAFFFMVFISLGFFGTGNIASVNSFDPMWVRGFLTVFSPFKMMGLIVLKFVVPFIFTCCVFRAINAIGKENVLNMFCIILLFSDIMVFHFVYLIQNYGSWFEIGSSLSRFVIMDGFVTILLLLYGIAYLITSVSG